MANAFESRRLFEEAFERPFSIYHCSYFIPLKGGMVSFTLAL